MVFSTEGRAGEFEAAALPHLNDIYGPRPGFYQTAQGGGRASGSCICKPEVIRSSLKPAPTARVLFQILSIHSPLPRKWFNVRIVKESEELIEQTALMRRPCRADNG